MYRASTIKKRPLGEDTFIPMPARVLAIVQLCLAFTVAIWILCGPYLDEYFSVRSDSLLYETVMGERVPGNVDYFQALPIEEQRSIVDQYRLLQERAGRPFLEKTFGALVFSLFETSPFKWAWVVLSVGIAVGLLKKKRGALQVVWLLPVVALCYGLFSVSSKTPSPMDALVPSEALIVSEYLKRPLSGSIGDQQNQLTLGWQRYLVSVWTREVPSDDKLFFEEQVKRGEFAFNVARLRLVRQSDVSKSTESATALILYVLWNFFFALMTCHYLRKEVGLQQEHPYPGKVS
jgi:hypothetical protein